MNAARLAPALVLLALAPALRAFTVEVGQVATLLDVEVTATALDQAALIRVINRGAVAAECELRIDSGPEERVRTVLVPASSSKVIVQTIRPSTQRVRIAGICR